MDIIIFAIFLDSVYCTSSTTGSGYEDVCTLLFKIYKVIFHYTIGISSRRKTDCFAIQKKGFPSVCIIRIMRKL